MKKGIVMEVQSQQLIVMTPNGEFYRIHPNRNDLVEGEEIEFVPPPERQPAKRWVGWKRASYALAASLLVLLAVLPLWNMMFTTAYAAVSIDINPSLELELDKEYRVIDATAYNDEGKRLLDKMEWKKHSFIDVASNVIAEARRQGFMRNNHDVLIAPVGLANPKASDELVRLIQKKIPILTAGEKGQVTITLMESNKEEREEAKKNGMSVGKFALYESLKKNHKELSKDSIKKLSISEIRTQVSKSTEAAGIAQKNAGTAVSGITQRPIVPSLQPATSNKRTNGNVQKSQAGKIKQKEQHPAASQSSVVKNLEKTVKEEKVNSPEKPKQQSMNEKKSTAQREKTSQSTTLPEQEKIKEEKDEKAKEKQQEKEQSKQQKEKGSNEEKHSSKEK